MDHGPPRLVTASISACAAATAAVATESQGSGQVGGLAGRI